MALNIVEKILQEHVVEGKPRAGEQVGLKIDQTLTQDATGTMAYLQFESLGIPRVRTELSVSYVDHNTLQDGFENADDHRFLQSVAAKYGILYSRAGNGICHQVHLERFGVPGKTLIGSDSHSPTAGGIGMLAMGAGGLDVAVAMAGGPFFIKYPQIMLVRLTGSLRPWVSTKDVVLHMLQLLTTKGNVGWMIEYGGAGVATLSVPERATITNMGAEMGVTTSVFPSDEKTREFLLAQGREEVWTSLEPDPGAAYDRTLEVDLGSIEALTAQPHSPDNVCRVADIAGLKVDQVCIGSCTNSSYKDLVTVASILKGNRVHSGTSLVVAPGSRQVLQMMSREGYLDQLLTAGARIMETTCGFCIGMGQAPPTDAVSLRTNNRNFEGRSGTKSAKVYLVSPETAAVSAVRGVVTDPGDLGEENYPRVETPAQFLVDDSMILPPSTEPEKVEIIRGPNIGAVPKNDPLPEEIHGEVLLKVGDKITTDHIMPAGSKLKYRSNIQKYATFVFEPLDPGFSGSALKLKGEGGHGVVVGGMSYGQGSSREHAALCPMYLGLKAVIAKSIERIHAANLVNFGILPLAFEREEDYERIEAGDQIKLSDVRRKLESGEKLVALNVTKSTEIPLQHSLSERDVAVVLAGGLLNYVASGATTWAGTSSS